MMINRRGLLGGLITALSAPAIIRTPGILMPVKPAPQFEYVTYEIGYFLERDGTPMALTSELRDAMNRGLALSMMQTKLNIQASVLFRVGDDCHGTSQRSIVG